MATLDRWGFNTSMHRMNAQTRMASGLKFMVIASSRGQLSVVGEPPKCAKNRRIFSSTKRENRDFHRICGNLG